MLCLGRKYAMLKLKILLSTIMRNFRIHSDMKENEFKLQADIILKRSEGFRVRLQRRKLCRKPLPNEKDTNPKEVLIPSTI